MYFQEGESHLQEERIMMYTHIKILHVFLLLHGLAKHLNRKPNKACQCVLYYN